MTFPQFRPGASTTHLPSQDQYPVWYFFYGTLADAAVLSRLLDLPADCVPTYREARVRGGQITTWAGKYLGLVDGDRDAVVRGSEYLVGNTEDENALRYYETDKYEVVRSEIKFEGNGGRVMGLTFRLRDG
jgi:hypothetical protein